VGLLAVRRLEATSQRLTAAPHPSCPWVIKKTKFVVIRSFCPDSCPKEQNERTESVIFAKAGPNIVASALGCRPNFPSEADRYAR